MTDMPNTFKARYRGTCRITRATILPGDTIKMVGIEAVLVRRADRPPAAAAAAVALPPRKETT